MEKRVFITNINCDGCIAKATNTLNEMVGEGNWKVDTTQPTKPLTVNKESVSTNYIKTSLGKIGFKAELM